MVKDNVSNFFDWLILRALAVRIFSSGPGVQTAPSFTICTTQSFHGWLKDVNIVTSDSQFWIQTTQVIKAKANLFISKRKTYFMIKKTMFVVKH